MGKQFLNADANRNASWREEERSGTERARTDRPQNLWIADDEGLILLVPNGNYPHFSERLDAPSRVSSVVWMGCNSRAGGVVVGVGRVRMRRNGFLGFFRSSSSRISTFFPNWGSCPWIVRLSYGLWIEFDVHVRWDTLVFQFPTGTLIDLS